MSAPRSLDTRQMLLEVAETRFASEGFAGAHLQAIADEVGVRKTALYHYFPSKEALYTAVLERMIDAFGETVDRATRRELPHVQRMERLLDDVNDLLAEHPNYSRIVIRIFVDGAPFDRTAIGPRIRGLLASVTRFYREGVDAGAFRRLSSRHFLQTLLGSAVFYYAASRFSANVLEVDDPFARSAVAWRRDELRRLVLHGVLPDGSPARERDEPRPS